jgi:hypothetical protein
MHDGGLGVALDRPTRLLRRRFERRSVPLKFEACGQRHVERLTPWRMVTCGHPASLVQPWPIGRRYCVIAHWV